MLPASIKQAYNDVPPGIKTFAKKAAIFFAAWLVLYYGIMRPTRVPDKFLTEVTAKTTVSMVNKFYKPGFGYADVVNRPTIDNEKSGVDILYNNGQVLFITDGCNAFDLFVLYIAFLVCVPTTIKRLISFSVIGVLTVFVLNIARCFALVYLVLNKPSYVDFAHHYAFTLIVYAFIFYGWVLYSKKANVLKINTLENK